MPELPEVEALADHLRRHAVGLTVGRVDVSALSVHAQSSSWISSIGPAAGLKADFGSGTWNGGPIGIPYAVVPGSQPKVPVHFTIGVTQLT